MTKQVFNFFFLVLLLFSILSCTAKKDKNNPINNPEIKDSSRTEILATDPITTPLTDITPLPFTGSQMVEIESKLLPPIDSIIYSSLNTGFDFNFNQTNALHHLKTYSNQLPNIANMEVYYSQFNCDNTQDSALRTICDNYAGLSCGFLILINPTSSTAQIINISNSYYIDSGIDMQFEIDTNYQIHIHETGMTDGDIAPDGTLEPDIYNISTHLITISENGNIRIKN